MGMSFWMLASLVCRLLVYAGVAGAIGGVFSRVLLAQHHSVARYIGDYTVGACVLGVGAAVLSVLINVGNMADRGMEGMMDITVLRLVLQTPLGIALALQVVGFVAIAIAGRADRLHLGLILLAATGALSIAASFALTGHLADGGWVGQVAVSAHALAMALWIGSLYPLRRVCATGDVTAVQQSMHRFGQLAAAIVGVLVACGVVMATQLLTSWRQLFDTPYGWGLLAKFSLVGSLLLLAATNKWLTVPRLTQPGFRQRLGKSIVLEIGLATCVLVITAVVTIVIGLEQHS
jgi:copper resistance protein D